MSSFPVYKEHLTSACKQLHADMVWFARCAGYMAFSKEMKLLWDVFEEGESIPVSRQFLRSVNDPAVRHLTNWIVLLEETLFSLANTNAIDFDTITAERSEEPPQRVSGEQADIYAKLLNAGQVYLADMQFYLIDHMLELADNNPLCEEVMRQFSIAGNPSVFANSPDENINRLYVLFLVAVRTANELASAGFPSQQKI